MELIGSIFLVLALALIVGLFIARPFITGSETAASIPGQAAEQAREHQRSALLAERDRVLNALQELDFDNALGKVPAEEYPIQRAALLKAGAETLRRLDEMAVSEPAELNQPGTVEDRIEAAVATRRADSVGAAQVQNQKARQPVAAAAVGGNGSRKDELEEIIASRKRERKESAGGFCPSCGKPVSKSDKFCSKCGATL